MTTSNDRRLALIQRTMAHSICGVAETAVDLWQPLASKLIAIIGEHGFNSLYERSLYLLHDVVPWLAPRDAVHAAVDLRFDALRSTLESRPQVEAHKASYLLLLTFTDLVAALVGESLMTAILSAAWGDEGADTASAGKEFSNE
jgi:hypothetical protein